MSQAREYVLRIGGCAQIKRGFITSHSVIYAGMLNDYLYSVVVTSSSGNKSMAYNLYVPKDHREIELPKGRLVVSRVSSRDMHFRYEP